MNLTLEQFGIDRLDAEQRCELISLIWDSLPEETPIVPPPWHLPELERRIADADANPDDVERAEDLLARLSNKR
jgi:putative addiction module component (TIGR02574 family)